MNGIVLLDKKEGLSTTKEEAKLKSVFQTKKVGHAGTLDPFASGLVICGINKGTKVLTYLEGADKTYLATLKLGQITSTQDKTGEVIDTKEVKEHSFKEISSVLSSFLGVSMQTPPMYSALKVNGQRLYKLARNNIEIERKPRQIEVKSIRLISYENGEISFEANVSKGTYIRTLGVDIAEKLGEYGHLISLRRTKIGEYDLSLAKQIDKITPDDLIQIKDVYFLDGFTKVVCDDAIYKKVINGNFVYLKNSPDSIMFMYKDEAIALYQRLDKDKYKVLQEF